MKRCLIITGGKLDLSFAGSFLGQETFDKIIAVDAGLEAVKALGLEPDMIVGDFDTVKPEVLAYYRRMEHIVWDTHQPEKDETDTELALLKAQATGCTEVVVLGATGGRMDHMLGNIHLLFPCLQKGMEAYILDSQNRIYLMTRNGRLIGVRSGENISPSSLLLRRSGALPSPVLNILSMKRTSR
jgi:thiamine pyrophosphokinase